MKIDIELIDSKWFVNGKTFDKMTILEKIKLNEFFKEYKKDSNYIK